VSSPDVHSLRQRRRYAFTLSPLRRSGRTCEVGHGLHPPSAGAHYPLWAVWGFYRTPINPRQVVHNEEHGAVVIWWGPKVPSSTVNALQAFYNEKPAGMSGTPIAGLGNKIALTSWTSLPGTYYANGNYGIGHVAVCPRFEEHAFTVFRNAYRGHSPQAFPLAGHIFHPRPEPVARKKRQHEGSDGGESGDCRKRHDDELRVEQISHERGHGARPRNRS